MASFRVDDVLSDHPKVLAAGNAAMGLWVRAGAWSMRHLTDGFIPDAVAALHGTSREATALVDSGLWIVVDGGYLFHAWDSRQPSRDEVEERRRQRSEAGRRGGLKSAASKREANGQANAKAVASASVETGSKQTATPSRPVPSPDNQDRYNNPPEVDARAEDDVDPVLASVVDACRGMGIEIHPLCAADVVGFIDSRRSRRAAPPKVPTRYYPDAIRKAWHEVSKFIYTEGLVA